MRQRVQGWLGEAIIAMLGYMILRIVNREIPAAWVILLLLAAEMLWAGLHVTNWSAFIKQGIVVLMAGASIGVAMVALGLLSAFAAMSLGLLAIPFVAVPLLAYVWLQQKT